MGIFDRPDYTEYRNPKFEKTIKYLNLITQFIIPVLAAAAITKICGRWVTWAVIILCYLIRRMTDQMIYFYDNKGLGPSWKTIFLEDFTSAFRIGTIVYIFGYVVCECFL